MKPAEWFGLLSFVVLVAIATAGAQEVSVGKGTGYGSVGIYARTFGTVIVKSGTAIKYVPDAVNGDSFVINASGLYAVSYTDGDTSSDDIGISLNLPPTASFTTGEGTAHELCEFEVADTGGSCSATVNLAKGSVLRAHSTFGGPPPNDQIVTRFIVVKIQ
jgi:hypothetical protein